MRPGLLVALLTVALLAAPVGAAQSAGSSFDDPTTTYTFELKENGDANVTVTVAYSLDSANETEAFRDLSDGFERGAVGPDIAVFQRAADAASEATGREMNLSEATRTASFENESENETVGVLELSFEWTNFATAEGATLRVGDAFQTPSGTWLPGLQEGQRLRVVSPDEYVIEDAAAARIEGGALVWEGPTTFDEEDLEVVLSGDEPATPSTTPPNGPGPGGEEGGGLLAQLLSPVGGGMLVVLAVAVVGLYVVAARRDGEGALSGVTAVDGGTNADTPPPDDGPATQESPPDAAEAEAAAEADAESEPDADGPFAGVDEDLLSDEERVERLLEYNGGRMRQANIVTETGWSNAKVSQLLSAMDDDDRVDKLRIGRENLISLPNVDNGTGNNGGS